MEREPMQMAFEGALCAITNTADFNSAKIETESAGVDLDLARRYYEAGYLSGFAAATAVTMVKNRFSSVVRAE
jgi:hypothetical protein